MRCILNRVLLALSWISIRAAADAQMLLKKQGFSPKLAEMPLDEMRLMLEQWGNITGEPRGVDYTERVDACRHAKAIDIGGCGAGRLSQHCHPPCDHVAVLEVADAKHAVDPFADEIDQPIALAHVEFDLGIFREEVRQARQHEMARERAVDIDALQPLRLGAAERRLGILQIG